MKYSLLSLALLLALLSGCDKETVFHPLFRDQTLPSGAKTKVTMCALVWGGRPNDDGCTIGSDCFHLEFVSSDPNAELPKKTAEARQVFELIRPASEQWGFTNAELLAFKQVERTGDYDIFLFNRTTNGNWSCQRQAASVFAK
jgi:hypothetical protein